MAGLQVVPPEHRDSWRMHRVGIGETVAEVGKRYGISVNSLVAANNLQSREAGEGDRLIIPAVVRAEPVAAKKVAKRGASGHRNTTSTGRTTGSTGKGKAPAAQSKSGSKPKLKAAPKSPVIAATTKPRPAN